MIIINTNFNAIRSACSKGVLPGLAQQMANVACVQENKRSPEFERSIAWSDPTINIQWCFRGETTSYAKNQQTISLAAVERFA
ncbi:hypothetical protein [Candidatus Nitrotoga sp. M5]|uniref:hypothetical protein n=1 Tax=Candidatus Nitrotoga sp. M5 TaxID=2890409 RepID=UPI001EF19447|nr:hypothetical protein [Candidatus Nitrotoga sp. M5]